LEYSSKELVDLSKSDTPNRYNRRGSIGRSQVVSADIDYSTGNAIIKLNTHDHIQTIEMEDFVGLVSDEILSKYKDGATWTFYGNISASVSTRTGTIVNVNDFVVIGVSDTSGTTTLNLYRTDTWSAKGYLPLILRGGLPVSMTNCTGGVYIPSSNSLCLFSSAGELTRVVVSAGGANGDGIKSGGCGNGGTTSMSLGSGYFAGGKGANSVLGTGGRAGEFGRYWVNASYSASGYGAGGGGGSTECQNGDTAHAGAGGSGSDGYGWIRFYNPNVQDGYLWKYHGDLNNKFGGVIASDVAYGNSLFVAITSTGYSSTSSDGASWSTEVSLSSNNLNTICWNGAMFVIGGSAGTILTSTDGSTWTTQTGLSSTSWGSTSVSKILWNGSTFMATGASGKVATSPDGVTWTYQSGLSSTTM
jgi:hypothetical protein